MVKFAVSLGKPAAIRYPRGEAYAGLKEYRAAIELGRSELLYAGSMVKTAAEVKAALNAEGRKCSVINARFVKPIDLEAVTWAAENHKLVVTMEENVASGGYGEKVRDAMSSLNTETKLLTVAIPDEYVEHGNVDLLKQELGISAERIMERIKKEIRNLE